jgi:hypothetical protein
VLTTNGNGVLSFSNIATGANGTVQFSNGSGGLTGGGNLLVYTNGNLALNGANLDVIDYDSVASRSFFRTYAARGVSGAPQPVQVGDQIMNLQAGAYTGNGSATVDGTTGWVNQGGLINFVTQLPSQSGYRTASNVAIRCIDGANGAVDLVVDGLTRVVTVPGNITNPNSQTTLTIVKNNGNISLANTSIAISANGIANAMVFTGNSVNVSVVSNLGPVGNVAITGGSNGQLLSTNGSGILSFTSNLANVTFQQFRETVVAGGSVSGTITPDVASGSIFTYTLTGAITLNALANVTAGSSATIKLIQDATGSRTLTSTWKFLGGAKTLSTNANAIDVISVTYDGTDYLASLGRGYA